MTYIFPGTGRDEESGGAASEEEDIVMDLPQPDEKFEAKWKRKLVYVSATGMSLQVYDRKSEKPLANYTYQKCQAWSGFFSFFCDEWKMLNLPR